MKLINQEIWLAYPNIKRLCGDDPDPLKQRVTFPVKISLGLARLAARLQGPYTVIERERAKLVKKYGVMDEAKKKITVASDGETASKFALELSELLMAEWPDDISIEKVAIPQKMSGKCEHCGQPMDIVVLIEPQILIPLAEHFVEVV